MQGQVEPTAINPMTQPSLEYPSGPAGVQTLTPDQRRRLEDVAWAEEDLSVLAAYRGEFVVPYARQIVAHGHDIQAVLSDAARKTGRKLEELLVVGIDSPLQDVPH